MKLTDVLGLVVICSVMVLLVGVQIGIHVGRGLEEAEVAARRSAVAVEISSALAESERLLAYQDELYWCQVMRMDDYETAMSSAADLR